MIENHPYRAKRLINKFKQKEIRLHWFFIDGFFPDLDQNVNGLLCTGPIVVSTIMHTKFPVTVIVLGVVSYKGEVMPPNFFSKGLKVNVVVLTEVLEKVARI